MCLIVKDDYSIYSNHKSGMHNTPWYIIAFLMYQKIKAIFKKKKMNKTSKTFLGFTTNVKKKKKKFFLPLKAQFFQVCVNCDFPHRHSLIHEWHWSEAENLSCISMKLRNLSIEQHKHYALFDNLWHRVYYNARLWKSDLCDHAKSILSVTSSPGRS